MSISLFQRKYINAAVLRGIALTCMLLDHIAAAGLVDAVWLRCVGRLAFPIFAFQIAEGFLHTSNRKRYAARLFVFGIISEIPLNLFLNSSVFYPQYQNVMFTLFLGLISLVWLEKLKQEKSFYALSVFGCVLLISCLTAIFCRSDYGAMGVLTIVVFYLFRDFRGAWIFQLGSMVLLNVPVYLKYGACIALFEGALPLPIQGFAVLALIPIWLYNGEKGRSNKFMQYAFYAFYPLHMIALYIIGNVI